MGISALTLGGWISLYCGISLLRTTMPELNTDQAPPTSSRKLAIFAAGLVILGVMILARSLLHLHLHQHH